MSRMIESRLRGLRERRLLCLRELDLHLARGASNDAGVTSCLEQIERINQEMLRVASSKPSVKEREPALTSGL
ncbi:MAG: hypothetical protein AAFR75_09860 [Pseudomonadota bacterium]